MTTDEAIKTIRYCATHEPAHFGGSYGMFVDVPVEALKLVLEAIDKKENHSLGDRLWEQ